MATSLATKLLFVLFCSAIVSVCFIISRLPNKAAIQYQGKVPMAAGTRVRRIPHSCWFSNNSSRAEPACSQHVIAEYQQQCGYFPTEGYWLNVKQQYPAPRFMSPTCDLPTMTKESSPLLHYLKHHKSTRHIVLLGDSHGRLYFRALRQHVMDIGYTCTEKRAGKSGPHWHAAYFATNDTGIRADQISTGKRTCISCVNSYQECSLNSTRNDSSLPPEIAIEYISFILGDTKGILPNPEHCPNTMNSDLCKVESYYEFILKFYFRKRMPDVFLHFASFAHDVVHPAAMVNRTLRQIVSLLKATIPSTTKYMFVTSSPTVVAKLPKTHISHSQFANPEDYNRKIELFNSMLYDTLFSLRVLSSESNIRTWFDLFEVGSSAITLWMTGKEGIHFPMAWYDTILEYLVAAL